MKNFPTKLHPHSQYHRTQESQNQETEAIEEQEEEKARCEWDFSLTTIVSSGGAADNISTPAISDALGVIEFDQTNSTIATGGIARKIRIYKLQSLLPHENTGQDQVRGTTCLDHARACDYYICTPAKLSSIRWKPGSYGAGRSRVRGLRRGGDGI
ncbi:hypothetical protein OIU84_001128 [Salix udensis]|uniref:Uncharacterized protein n=1 Tax=Salix udensis TaxID=889485 RepID=A0AAD6P5M2_9ROSI|nr:hypothetical protein OIU84_001128 [Salix udensis]